MRNVSKLTPVEALIVDVVLLALWLVNVLATRARGGLGACAGSGPERTGILWAAVARDASTQSILYLREGSVYLFIFIHLPWLLPVPRHYSRSLIIDLQTRLDLSHFD